MRLNPPKQLTFWIGVALGATGFICNFLGVAALEGYSFWLLALGFFTLVLGNTVKDL